MSLVNFSSSEIHGRSQFFSNECDWLWIFNNALFLYNVMILGPSPSQAGVLYVAAVGGWTFIAWYGLGVPGSRFATDQAFNSLVKLSSSDAGSSSECTRLKELFVTLISMKKVLTSWCPRICPSCCCYSLDAITKSLLVLFDTSSCGGPLHLPQACSLCMEDIIPQRAFVFTRVAFLLRWLITHIHCLNWYLANVHNSLWSLTLSEGSQGWFFNTCTLT